MPRREPQLLAELFQYRQRERRTPLEDFLTAAFTGFARTLSREQQFELASALFVSPAERVRFHVLCKGSSEYRWDTQYILPCGKRPDMVFWLDGVPAIVVENKIWSGIRSYEEPDAGGTDDEVGSDGETVTKIAGSEVSQLKTYGRWLRSARSASSWKGSLVLLTHGTPPPDDFQAANIDGYGAIPHTCRWSAVYAWIRALMQDQSSPALRHSAARFLGAELASFLDSKGLVMKPLTFADVDALGIHFASRKPMDAAFQETLAAVRTSFPDLVAAEGARAIKYENGWSVVQGWVYLKGEGMPRDTYYGWGFRFPAISSWWEDLRDQLPEENHVFGYIGSDRKEFPASTVPEDMRPPGWFVAYEGKELIGVATFSALPAAETFQQAFALWTVAQLEALRPALAHVQAVADTALG